mgnify:CR=1 FL=1
MKKEILGKYILQTPLPEHAKQQAELQEIVFPTLSAEELITEEKYKRVAACTMQNIDNS